MNQGLLNFAKSLENILPTTIQFFEKDDYFCIGEDAKFLSTNYFKSNLVIKTLNDIEYIAITSTIIDQLLKFILLVKRYRIEIYSSINGGWQLSKKGSPGNLEDFESIIKENPTTVNGISAAKFSKTVNNSIKVGFSFIDLDNFIFYVYDFVDDSSFANLESVLMSLSPKECLVMSKVKNQIPERIITNCGLLVTHLKISEANLSNIKSDFEFLLNKTKSDSELIENPVLMKDSMKCLSGSIKYMNLIENESLMKKFSLLKFNLANYVRLDAGAFSALHLTNSEEKRNKNSSIFGILNKCQTTQGQRLLYMWIHQPLTDVNAINQRFDLVEVLMKNIDLHNYLKQDFLIGFPDLANFTKRLLSKTAELKDCYRIYCAAKRLTNLINFCALNDSKALCLFINEYIEPFKSIQSELNPFQCMIEETLDFSKIDDNEFKIRPGFNDQLQFLDNELKSLQYKFDEQFKLVSKELYSGPNKSLKMEFLASSGYYFKLTLKEEKNLRGLASFSILETSKSGVKFTNSKMEQLNNDYLEYTREMKQLHKELKEEILNIAGEYADQFILLNDISANLDVICSYASFALNSPSIVCRPKIMPSEAGIIEFKDMKHPLLERFLEGCVIPNDLCMSKNDGQSYFHVITGPNMGGKSTFIRTAALMVYLSQIGCFVPCSEAKVSVVDAILVRIGADDNINRGISTFMAEMIDTSSIIRNATSNSLIVVDELGRGTSTYDGLGLTWSISRYIHDKIKCYCLFATHFHEMTSIIKICSNVSNYYSAAVESDDGITMLYRIEPGISKQSYGLNAAKFCGFPENIIKSAEIYAKEYELIQSHDLVKVSDNSVENDELMDLVRELKSQAINLGSLDDKVSFLKNMIETNCSVDLKKILFGGAL